MALQKIMAHVSAVKVAWWSSSSQAFESVRKAHCAALATSLASHSWCPEDASVASTKLASSSFSDADKASLCKVVADGLAQSVQTANQEEAAPTSQGFRALSEGFRRGIFERASSFALEDCEGSRCGLFHRPGVPERAVYGQHLEHAHWAGS